METKIVLHVQDLCQKPQDIDRVQHRLSSLDGVAAVTVSFDGDVTVVPQSGSSVTPSSISKVIRKLGYIPQQAAWDAAQDEGRGSTSGKESNHSVVEMQSVGEENITFLVSLSSLQIIYVY